jgi:uncharacterized RDD family membrane protein YckC
MNSYSLEKQSLEEKTRYGGFWIRFAAYLLDSIVLGIPLTIIIVVIFVISLGSMEGVTDPSFWEQGEITDKQVITLILTYIIAMVLAVITSVAYFAGMHASSWQATIGKKLLKLKVTDIQGNRITFWRAFGRLMAMVLLSGILYIGYIMIAFTEKKQSLHDLIAGTVVIQVD